jgi:ditrans,polycis-polyprenyl diphosphate synthase
MSWIREEKLTWLQKLAINVIICGPVPNHVSFIMDGNRRFAEKSHINKAEGHSKGFDKLSETLQWCLEVGIMEVTVYAFSIENFKRSKEEVDTLMGLAREKFARMLDERDKLHEKGVKIRVIGNLKMLPQDLQKTIYEAMQLTKDNNKAILNVAFAYTSRDEITNSIKTIFEGVENNELEHEDLSYGLIDKCLYTSKFSDVDLLVRTSGEVRFSDFLLWQVSYCIFFFATVICYLATFFIFRHRQQFFILPIRCGRNSPFGIYSVLFSITKGASCKNLSSRATSKAKSLL